MDVLCPACDPGSDGQWTACRSWHVELFGNGNIVTGLLAEDGVCDSPYSPGKQRHGSYVTLGGPGRRN